MPAPRFWKFEEIEEEKNICSSNSSTQAEDAKKYNEMRRTVRNSIESEKNRMWDKKCGEINAYIGERRCLESWKFIISMETSRREEFHPIKPLNAYYRKTDKNK